MPQHMPLADVSQFVGQDRADFLVILCHLNQLVGDDHDSRGECEGVGTDHAAVPKFQPATWKCSAGTHNTLEEGGKFRAPLHTQPGWFGHQAVEYGQRLTPHAAFD